MALPAVPSIGRIDGLHSPHALLGALGVRILLKLVAGGKVPQDVITPDLPMITKESDTVFGIETVSIDKWRPYTYGRQE